MIRAAAALVLLCLSLLNGGVDAYVGATSLGGSLYLVNKTYRLTQAYEPPDLVQVGVPRLTSDVRMRREAAGMLEALFEAALGDGCKLVAVSGYRSYDRQAAIYRRKVSSLGSEGKAGLLVAPPGASEHQLGLAMDVGRRGNPILNAAFGSSREGQWLADNAHRFGFIIRYKAEWTADTGYSYEPWHQRYVGADHARALRALDIPLEAYVRRLAEKHFGEYIATSRP